MSAPTYPLLWAHSAGRERTMEFPHDSEGIMRQGRTSAEEAQVRKKADFVWSTASHLHFNRDFRFNSQSTSMQFTPTKAIGGRAWPSLRLETEEQEKALTLWGNSTLGLLMYWWHANKQQAGRGSIGISALESLPVLDVTALPSDALTRAVTIFEQLKHKPLLPMNEIDHDAVRAELDQRFYQEVLGFPPDWLALAGPIALIRKKLALEPSIVGSKATTDAVDSDNEP